MHSLARFFSFNQTPTTSIGSRFTQEEQRLRITHRIGNSMFNFVSPIFGR